MKRFTSWICLVLTVMILAACGQNPTTALPTPLPPSLADVPFTSAELGYSLRYPKSWVIEEGEEPGVVIFLDNRVKPAASGLPALPVTLTVIAGSRSALNLPSGEITQPAVLNPVLQKLGVGMKIEAKAPAAANVAGKPAARVEVGGTLNVGSQLEGRVVAVDLGSRVWAIFALSPSAEWAAFATVFDQMINSVVFMK